MKIFGIIVTIILIISLAVYFTTNDSTRIKRLHTEFKSADIESELYGKIADLKTDKGACFITLETKKIFLKTSGNYLYPEVYLDHVLAVGDIIEKKSGSDTIFIYKGEAKYYFVPGKFINKKH